MQLLVKTFTPLSVGLFVAGHRLIEILHLNPPRSVMPVNSPKTVSKHGAPGAGSTPGLV